MLSIILPTRNEPRILEVLRSLKDILKRVGVENEIIVIDKSDDDTLEKAIQSGAKGYGQEDLGLGNALRQGMKKSMGSLVLTMDADMSHDPSYIPAFLEKISEGYDVIVGSRKMPGGAVVGWGAKRKAISWGANFLGSHIAGVKVSDLTSGYRLYKREVLEAVDLDTVSTTGYAFQLEILARAQKKGFRIGNIPFTFHDRTSGTSKLSRKDIFDFAWTSLRLGLARI